MLGEQGFFLMTVFLPSKVVPGCACFRFWDKNKMSHSSAASEFPGAQTQLQLAAQTWGGIDVSSWKTQGMVESGNQLMLPRMCLSVFLAPLFSGIVLAWSLQFCPCLTRQMALCPAYRAKPWWKEHRPLSLSRVPFQSLKIPRNTSLSLIEHLLLPSLCSVAHLGQGDGFMGLTNFNKWIWENVLGIRLKICFSPSGLTTMPSISPELLTLLKLPHWANPSQTCFAFEYFLASIKHKITVHSLWQQAFFHWLLFLLLLSLCLFNLYTFFILSIFSFYSLHV